MPEETINLESFVQRRSRTSSVWPMSLPLVDHLKILSERLMEILFSLFCQRVMHLSSEPDAK